MSETAAAVRCWMKIRPGMLLTGYTLISELRAKASSRLDGSRGMIYRTPTAYENDGVCVSGRVF